MSDIHFLELQGNLENAGRDCWNGCKKQQGKCEWCGFDGYCCRKNFAPGNGCDGSFGGQNRHVCVLKDEGTYDNCLLHFFLIDV